MTLTASTQQRLPSKELSTSYSENTSLALETLHNRLNQMEGKIGVLDLGRPCNANVQFFSQFSCKLHIVDLYSFFNEMNGVVAHDEVRLLEVEKYVEQHILTQQNVEFDVILVWDLMNYMEKNLLQTFFKVIIKYCHKGTLLFVLNASQQLIPNNPSFYKIVRPDCLGCEQETVSWTQSPRLTPGDLQRFLPGFVVYRSFLLKSGMQEILFEYAN